jgi:hypothetical protein
MAAPAILPPLDTSVATMAAPLSAAETSPNMKHSPTVPQGDQPAHLRSWMKKYRKMKLRFDSAMRGSSQLVTEEHGVLTLASRIQEQNEYVTLLSV